MDDFDDGDLPQSAPAPAPVPPVPAAPSGAVSLVQDEVLGSVTHEQSMDLLKLARAHGVKEDDPLWVAVLAIIRAQDISGVIDGAAGRIEATARGVGKDIYDQAMMAGNDLAESAAKNIRGEVVAGGRAAVASIAAAILKGADDLRKAAAGLEKMGNVKACVVVNRWTDELFAKIEKQASTSVLYKSTSSAVTMLTIFLLVFCLGAGSALGWADASGHLLPTRYVLRQPTAPGGGCGQVKGWSRLICPVRKYHLPF